MSAIFVYVFGFDYNVVSFSVYTSVTWLFLPFPVPYLEIWCVVNFGWFSIPVFPVPTHLAVMYLWNNSFHCIQSVCAKVLNSLSASLGCSLSFVMNLWAPTSVETRLLISSCIHKDAWIYLLIFVLKNAFGKQLLPGRVQNVLFPYCAQPGLFVVENHSGMKKQGTTPFQNTEECPFFRQGTKAVESWVRRQQVWDRWVTPWSVPFSQQMLMSGCCGDILQRKVLAPRDATPCYILARTSEPLTQSLPPGSQSLPFPKSLSTWVTYLYRWLEDDSSILQQFLLLSSKAKRKKKYFKCFGKTIVTSEHPFSSQHLLWKRVAVRAQFYSLRIFHVCPKGCFTAPPKKVLPSFARLTANQKLPCHKWQVAMTSPGDQQDVDRWA